jgi:hypothetical protein
MVGSGSEPVGEFIDRAPATPAGLWSLISTAAAATASLSLIPGQDDDLSLSAAIVDLRAAVIEVERIHPQPHLEGVVWDVDDAAPDGVLAHRSLITGLIGAAERLAAVMPEGPPAMSLDLLTATRVVHLLALAGAHVLGPPDTTDPTAPGAGGDCP